MHTQLKGGLPTDLTPQRFVELVEAELKQPRPDWAKRAGAQILHVIFPKISAQTWFLRLKSPERIIEDFNSQDIGWLAGAVSRAFFEILNSVEEMEALLAIAPWLTTLQVVDGQVKPEGGTGINELLAAMLAQ